MSKSTRRFSVWHYPFWVLLGLTLVVYVLRVLEILTAWPGGVILVLGAFAIAFGILYGIDNTRRF